MHCPFCSQEDTRVTDSRVWDNGDSIRRRRECPSCKRRFWTFERRDTSLLWVLKKNGSRQAFDRGKIRAGLDQACRKRPVSSETKDAIVDELERDLRALATDGIISSVTIGELIMERLIDIDEVAYVRFASVYKAFNDVNSFSDFLAEMSKRCKNEEK
ncbi:transcriptional repressor NrdR [bacterium]|nr:transcriptional repressor NrdR [bacterium]